tara:strand:- start:261 stop:566 length:306 start_codon:yes stop_codon:yes gene_type:complete
VNLLNSQREAFHARLIILEGDGSSSAIELLKVEYDVAVASDPSHRGMVASINGLENSDHQFWRYAVGESKIPKPASEIVPVKGEQVIWWYGDNPDPPSLTQ